jgi:signal transduction histidine kinase
MALGLFVAIVLATSIAMWALSGPAGLGERRHFFPGLPILGLVVIVTVIAVGRSARRMAGPIGDVMDAADRVASGNYDARVEERGTPEMRRLARSFNEMTERLRVGEDQRRNLLADVAHELRTPLTVIRGTAEGMLDGLYPPDAAHLQPVVDGTRVMSRLLDDLQTLSTAEAGALRLHRTRMDPGQLAEDAVAAFTAQAGAAGIRLGASIAPELPQIDVDPVRIGEVLVNLLSNALRHTPAGGSVSLGAARASTGVVLTVVDTGAGIPPDDLPHIFDRFVKTPESRGAGLGLAIARALVEAHGGRITADSELGRGTTIRVVLPAAP